MPTLDTDDLLRGEETEDLPSQNDLLVLKAIGGDSDAPNVSFQGIKRKLGLHQETLSRALHRLQRDGYIERLGEQGYRASVKGKSTISTEHTVSKKDLPLIILKAILPEDMSIQDIVSSMSYRWFGNLRWLGFGESGDETTMSWITNDSNKKITVKITEDSLTIESASGDSISTIVRSAYELFDHVAKILKAGSSLRLHSNASYPKAAA